MSDADADPSRIDEIIINPDAILDAIALNDDESTLETFRVTVQPLTSGSAHVELVDASDGIDPADDQFVLNPIQFVHDDVEEYTEPPDREAMVEMLEDTVEDMRHLNEDRMFYNRIREWKSTVSSTFRTQVNLRSNEPGREPILVDVVLEEQDHEE